MDVDPINGLKEATNPTTFYDHAAEKPISHPLVRKDTDGKHYMYMGASKEKGPEYRHHDGTKIHTKHGSFGTAIHPKDEDEQDHYEKLVGHDHPGFNDRRIHEADKFKKWKSDQMTIKTTPEDIKRKAKVTVGTPHWKQVIPSKKDKLKNNKPKHKKQMDEAEEMPKGAWREDHHQVLTSHGYHHQNTDPEHYSTYTHANGSHVQVSQNTGKWSHKGPNKKLTPTHGEGAKSLDNHLKDRRRAATSSANRKAKHQAMTDLGLKRVKGNLGGTYYEEADLGLLKDILAEAGRDSTAMKVRQDKEKNPHLFCKNCLWKTGGGQCPRHGGPPAPKK